MGDGVNIAARLEGICEPGGICLSEDAYRQVESCAPNQRRGRGCERRKGVRRRCFADAWRWRGRGRGHVDVVAQVERIHRPHIALPSVDALRQLVGAERVAEALKKTSVRLEIGVAASYPSFRLGGDQGRAGAQQAAEIVKQRLAVDRRGDRLDLMAERGEVVPTLAFNYLKSHARTPETAEVGLTDRNYESFCGPGNHVGLPGLSNQRYLSPYCLTPSRSFRSAGHRQPWRLRVGFER